MKGLLLFASLTLIVTTGRTQEPVPVASSAESPLVSAVRAADDRRIAAMIAGDSSALEAVLSDDLAYGHSTGSIDTKRSMIAGLTEHRMIYEKIDYRERVFVPAAAGVVLMRGRVVASIQSAGRAIALDLRFLAVWREEHGVWRFLAWQSTRLPDHTP